jgi:hypothetical protein
MSDHIHPFRDSARAWPRILLVSPPIELVDGEKLLDMLEKLELGLTPRMAYEIDEAFFADFKK